ncbi:hypothetical protein ASPFODRAFT_162503 [Aspergillus luchuensis CBS 106.47]|uniref:MINDY deubiquitinase domain-containing protein n=1 Tax=Aspergillus luchuensis (strain CBS 106.47) TaxID=1137211 RepID=A0A1M3TJB1_ASPLC|nr:hypothetical protein ASPFODRAFT_162503 [Aspergillus luchuensis CBS 106.47]
MVLRKRAPPRLNSLPQGNDRTGSRFTNSKLSPTSKSLSSSSPKRLTRPRRAQSSPQPHRVVSQESVFSPDLNTSPAFDLMPLEQAQRSPIRNSAGDGSNPWADELTARFGLDHQGSVGSPQQIASSPQGMGMVNGNPSDQVPSTSFPGAQERGAAEWRSDREYTGQTPVQLQSNNPFLKPKSPEPNPWQDRNSHTSFGESSLSQDGASGHLGQDEGYIPMTARLSLFDQPEDETPWVGEHSTAMPPPASSQPYEYHDQGQLYTGQETGIIYGTSNVPAAPYASQQTYLQPTSQLHDEGRESPARSMSTPATISSNTTGSSHVLIELDEAPIPPPKTDTPTEAPQSYNLSSPDGPREETLRHNPSDAPPLPDRLKGPGAVYTHSAFSGPISEAEAKRQQEQRSETYSIRHVNWADSTGKLRESPILVQNKNGPCPLLALVNALVLRSTIHDSQPPIVRALQTREQISLGLLIEALFDELTTRLGPDDEFPDIEALSRFLTMLHTGMNVNPRLTLESNDALGTFLETEDIRLYGTFGVPLVHGWVAAPSTEADAALARVGQYHEDIQLLPFRKQDLEDRVMRGNALTPEEELVMSDIQTIQKFTEFENATQLSTFGLKHLATTLQPGSFSILFRNDHFSTLYKHPQLDQLFTLVTDAGYSSHAEVVWESLVDVNGSQAGFFSGDFRPVSHDAPPPSDPSGPRTSSNTGLAPAPQEQRNSAMTPQEQADADYAYALALQYQEEEQRANATPNRDSTNRNPSQRASVSHPPSAGLAPGAAYTRNRSSSAVNPSNASYATVASGNRSSRQSQRPARYSQSNIPTVRPTDDDDVPPPSYEQAARSPVYPSPQRSPNFADSPNASTYQRNQQGRRPPGVLVTTGPSDRMRDRPKDCIVM